MLDFIVLLAVGMLGVYFVGVNIRIVLYYSVDWGYIAALGGVLSYCGGVCVCVCGGGG